MSAFALTRRKDNSFLAQIYLLTASPEIYKRIAYGIKTDRIIYSSVWLDGLSEGDYTLFSIASDMENGTSHADIEDLSNDEVVDFDVFRAICNAVVISAFGMDAVRTAEKKKRRKKERRRNEVIVGE